MSTTYLSDWRDKRIADLERQLEEARAQRDRARAYCAELASYVCEPIYDDVRNRAGIAADASAAAGDEMSMRWHDVQRAQARAESAERQVEKMRSALERAIGCINGLLARTPVRDVAETLAEARAAIDSAIAAEKRG